MIRIDKTCLDDLKAADGIIMGSPTYFGEMSSKLKMLIDESAKIHGELAGKVGAAFTSAGGIASGAETTCLAILQAMLIHGMIIQGRTDDKHYGQTAVGCPDDLALKGCEELGKRVAELATRLRGNA